MYSVLSFELTSRPMWSRSANAEGASCDKLHMAHSCRRPIQKYVLALEHDRSEDIFFVAVDRKCGPMGAQGSLPMKSTCNKRDQKSRALRRAGNHSAETRNFTRLVDSCKIGSLIGDRLYVRLVMGIPKRRLGCSEIVM